MRFGEKRKRCENNRCVIQGTLYANINWEVKIMTKSELINAVAEQQGIAKKDADAIVNCVFETIVDTLAAGDKVQLVGFGTFQGV